MDVDTITAAVAPQDASSSQELRRAEQALETRVDSQARVSLPGLRLLSGASLVTVFGEVTALGATSRFDN